MLTISCPICNYQFMVADKMLETGAKCPQCQHVFTPAPAAAPPPVAVPKVESTVPAPIAKANDGPRVGILIGSTSSESPPVTSRSMEPPKPMEPPISSRLTESTPSQPPRLTTLVSDIVNKVVHQTAAPARKGIAELTVIALTLGLIALGTIWPLRQGWLGIVLGAVGLALAAVAILKLFRGKIPGLSLPVTAAIVNTQAITLAVLFILLPPETPSSVQPPDPFPDIANLEKSLAEDDAKVRAHAVAGVGVLARSLGKSVPDLLTALNDPKAEVREAAADALGNMGPLAKAAFPVLDNVAKTDVEKAVRDKCVAAKTKIGTPQRGDLSDFLASLKDARAGLRAAAAQAIGMIGPDAKDADPPLGKALADPSADVRISAAQALWNIKSKSAKDLTPIAVICLQDKDSGVRSRAAAALGSFKAGDNEVLDALQNALGDSSGKVRVQAAYALGNIGLAAKKALPKLVEALHDSEVKVRLIAAQALWVLDKQTQGVGVLAEALKNPDAEIRINAAMSLGRIGKEAKSAVPALALALSDSDSGVREHVAEALYNIGPEAREAVPALILALDHADAGFRARAAAALTGIGPDAKNALVPLHFALKDKNAEVRLYAAQAIWAVEGKEDEALPVLKKILQDKESTLRPQAALVLALIGPKAAKLAPELHEALGDADAALRAAAAKALGDIGGPLTRPSYTILFELAKDDQPDEIIRSAAAEAVKKIGRPGKADVPTLIAALDRKYPASYRAGAAVSLWLMNREARPAVAALSKTLADPDSALRTTAALALAAIGPDAADAVPALIAALEHEDESLRGKAAYALGEIGTKASKASAPLGKLLANDKEKMSLRLHAAQALWAIAQESKEPLGPKVRDLIVVLSKGVLSQGLKEDEADLSIQSAETLAKIAGRAQDGDKDLQTALKEEAVPALQKALQGNRRYVRPGAAEALGAMGRDSRDSIPTLLAVLKETDPELRVAAAEAVGKIAAAEAQADKNAVRAKAAYSDLLFLSKVDQNEGVQKAAGTALAKIGRPTGDDVNILLQLLEDKMQPAHFRHAAGQVLGIVGPEAIKATVRLGKVLGNAEDDAGVRTLAAYALGDIGPPAKTELPALLAALKAPEVGIKAGAAYAFGEIFQGMKKLPAELVPALELAAEHPDINVSEAAKAAIKKIKSKVP
ncbi:MAG TPA: HEAT repeat domain-containing protein [Gemmataceae bacterium]|nr:HEAT repeat domain-containing protein [Gemmataceae bacterium]